MTTTIKITELTNIGANLASTTVFPVVNMAGTPTTQKTVLGNIANVILAGAGNAYVAVGAATVSATVTTNAQPNITSTGSLTGLTVSNASGIVNFSNTANVTLGAVGNLRITGGTAGQLLSTNGNGTLSWASDTTTYSNSNVVTLLSAFGSNTITTTGNVSVGNIIGNGQALTSIAGANVSGFVPNANVANTAFAVAGANVSGFVPNANVANTAFAVAAANVSGLGNISTINLTGSNSNVLYGNGVFAAVAGGANTGNVTFNNINVIGNGNLKLQPDSANANAYLDIYLTGGPDIHIAGNGETVILGTDDFANVAVNVNGNVSIQTGNVSGTKTWNFDTAGNLTLPLNSVVYETNIPDGALSGSAIALKPTGGTTANQQLLIYPTANDGDHIHMTSGNLYATELFLGSDNLYVKLANTGNVVINSNDGNSNTAMWTFDTTGNLSLPGDIIGPASANFTIYSNAAVHEFVFGDDGTFYAPDNVVLGGNSIYIGPGANTLTGIEHEVFIASSNNFAYVQAVVNNVSDNGSADWVALGAKGSDTGGQASLGFTSSGFGDANYTITGNGDGYVFVQSYAPGQTLLGGGGNLVLTTGNQGTTKDIIFGTGGFLTSNIFGRISHANNSLELSRAGATITFPDATEQSTAYISPSITGNWTLASGNNTVSISVPINGTYSIWVNGNIPNGIITYTATAVVTNTNVPVLGEQYGWFYEAGNALVLTSIPNQFVGTQGAISNASPYSGNTANVFTFGITNNSGNTAVVNYGYTKL